MRKNALTLQQSARRSLAVSRGRDAAAQLPVVASILLGMSCGTMILGLCRRLSTGVEVALDPRAVVAAAMIAMAIGVNVPQRLAIWLCRIAWFSIKSSPSIRGTPGPKAPDQGSDAAFHWMVVAVLTLAAGIALIVLPILVGWANALRESLGTAFLWPAPASLLLDALLAFATCGAPMVLLGVAWCGLHHLSCPAGCWDGHATIWALIGGGGWLSFLACAGVDLVSPDVLLAGAALPALAISLLVATVRSSTTESGRPELVLKSATPTLRDRWPLLLRAATVAIGGAGVCVALIWTEQANALGLPPVVIAASAAAAIGVGLLVAGNARSAPPSLAGLGVLGAIAGVLNAFGILSLTSSGEHPVLARLTPAWVGLLAIGYTAGYGRNLLWARAASRSIAGAAELTRMLLCAAMTVLVAGPLAIHLFGRSAALMMVALSLVALGGTLVIHDSNDSPRRRTARLLFVFACLAVMILLALLNRPGAGR